MASERMRAQVGTLIIATSCVQLANGFFGTFISLRVGLEGFEATMAGLAHAIYLLPEEFQVILTLFMALGA